MVIPAIVINHATPAISVVNQDSGVPPVTYNQIKQSLGSQVYQITGLNIYSTNINQLMGAIQYQIFDSGGNQNYTSITTTVDPYAGNALSIDVDLSKYSANFILNGNSSLAATILPLTSVKVQFYTTRITNAFGGNLENFKKIEVDANKPHFYNNYGDTIEDIQSTNLSIRDQIHLPNVPTPNPVPIDVIGKKYKLASGSNTKYASGTIPSTTPVPFFMLTIAAIGVGYYLTKNK